MREYFVDLNDSRTDDIRKICRDLGIEYNTLERRIKYMGVNDNIKQYQFTNDDGVLCCWLKFIGVDNWYITEDARVYKRVSERDVEMSPTMYGCDDCWWVHIVYKGRNTRNTLHKLYAKAFIPNPNNYKYVDFVDGNKTNVSKDNIIWVKNCKTRNIATNYAAERRCKPIVQLSLTNEFIKLFPSLNAAANELGVKPPNISACLRGNSSKSCGYKWMYKADYERLFGEIPEE